MGIRQSINQRPELAIGIIAAVIAAVLLLIILQLTGSSRHAGTPNTKAFFSDDDGQTYFQDSASNYPPFDHNGKTACGAIVLRCRDGKPFVAYLQRYDAATLEKIHAAMEQYSDQSSALAHMPLDPTIEVKRPGEAKWFSILSQPAESTRVTSPLCPDGSAGPFQTVTPGDANSGAKE